MTLGTIMALIQKAVSPKADYDSPNLTGTPTTSDITGSSPDNQIANKTYVDDAISALGTVFSVKGTVATAGDLEELTDVAPGDVYLVQEDSSEYVYTANETWEQLGPMISSGADKMPIVSYGEDTLVFDTTTVAFAKDGDNSWYISAENPISGFTTEDFLYDRVYTVTWDGVEYTGLFAKSESRYSHNDQYEWGRIGNIQPLGYDDSNDAPFCIEYDYKRNDGEVQIISYDTVASHTIKLSYTLIEKTIVDPLLYEASSKGHVPVRPGSGPMSVLESGAESSSAWYSHAEGASTVASAHMTHAEGGGTTASAVYAHAEGMKTTASGIRSHAEGDSSTASGIASHAEGSYTTASGDASHAEGSASIASGQISHAEGSYTTASGSGSHAEGQQTVASGSLSHAEGENTIANHRGQHVFGGYNIADPSAAAANVRGTYVEIVGNGVANAPSNARTLDWDGNEILAGKLTVGAGPVNNMDVATKQYTDTKATVVENAAKAYTDAHSLKWTIDFDDSTTLQATIQNDVENNVASAPYAHAEGTETTASGQRAHAEGKGTQATANGAHAEGYYTVAAGAASHAEGARTEASGTNGSHAEGNVTVASGESSHAEGEGTIASKISQHVVGRYNVEDPAIGNVGTYVEIVGNGHDNVARSNARTLDWSGNEVLAGKLTVGAGPTGNMDVATKQYADSLFDGGAANLADTYSSSTAYSIGDYCVYDGSLYKCNTAIANPGEEWNSSHWTAVTLSDELSTVAEASANNLSDEYSSTSSYDVGDYCVYEGDLYICNTAIASPGEVWNGSHWTATTVTDEFANIDMSSKVDVAQGVGHAGDFMVVGSDGNITTMTMSVWQGGSY